ncbi:hypothetical protein [Modestobacter sp. URMC 112]
MTAGAPAGGGSGVHPRPGAELATLLHLLGPADGRPGAAPLAALPWAPAGGGPPVLLSQLARRLRATATVAVASAAARRRPTVVRPTRGSLAPGTRDRLRRAAGRGLVAALPEPGRPVVLDRVLDDAGAVLASPLGVGADGAVRAMVTRGDTRGLLRMGLAGGPADPSGSAAGLRRLAAAGVLHVPALLASGVRDDVVWSLEAALPGSRPSAVSPALADRVAAFTAALPRADGPVDATADAEVIAVAVPSCAADVRRIAGTVTSSALAAQGRLRHGDLWAGNLLARGDELTGVVDWDAWSPAGLPGVDLLHLLATEERIRTRSALGEVWLRRPWDASPFADLARRHWPSWGSDAPARATVGTAWWLGQLASDLRRNPSLARDDRWVARNVATVTAALADSTG